MHRWMGSVSVPSLENDISQTETPSCFWTSVGSNIWIIFEWYSQQLRAYKKELFFLNTDTNQLVNIPLKFDETPSGPVTFLTSHEENLYILTGHYRMVLYVMDTTNSELEWTPVMRFDQYCKYTTYQTSGDYLYVLVKGWKLKMAVFNLKMGERPFMEDLVKDEFEYNWNGHLMSNNGSLYLVQHENNQRTVSRIEEEGLRIVCDEPFDTESHEIKWISTDAGNRIFYKHDYSKKLHLATFDFLQNEWVQMKIETGIHDPNFLRFQSAFESDNTIFFLVKGNSDTSVNYEIWILELQPNLTSICLSNVASKVTPTNTQAFEASLPIPLRPKLQSFINWKTVEEAEKEFIATRKLRYRQIYYILKMLVRMKREGVITEELMDEFLEIFVGRNSENGKDFDDASEEEDNDVSDISSEAVEDDRYEDFGVVDYDDDEMKSLLGDHSDSEDSVNN